MRCFAIFCCFVKLTVIQGLGLVIITDITSATLRSTEAKRILFTTAKQMNTPLFMAMPPTKGLFTWRWGTPGR